MANNNMDFSRISEDEKVNGIKITNVPKYIREKAYLTDFSETLAQLAEMIIQLGVNMGLSPDDALKWARKLQESVSQSEFDSWVATLLDGGPSIFMNTLSELQTTYPNGAAGVALVRETDPAKIYVWNGTAWEDFGDYQGIELKKDSVTTDKIKNKAVTFEKLELSPVIGKRTDNLINSSTLKDGYYISRNTGALLEVSDGSLFSATEMIPVIPNSNYFLKHLAWTGGAGYDSSGNFIQSLESGGFTTKENYEFETGPDTHFVRFGVPTESASENFLQESDKPRVHRSFIVAEKNTVNDDSIIDGSVSRDKLSEEVYDDLSKTKVLKRNSPNIFDATKYRIGYYNAIGEFNSADTRYISTDLIPVEQSTQYIDNNSITGRKVLFDNEGNFISQFNDNIFTTTADTAYFGATIGYDPDYDIDKLMEKVNTYMLVKGNVLPPKYYPFNFYEFDEGMVDFKAAESKWAGKRWGALGDSITFGYNAGQRSYLNYISEEKGILPLNYGINTSTVAYVDEPDRIGKEMVTRYLEMDNDLDLISVFGGTNDEVYNVPLGDLGDTVTSTFYGALNIIAEGLINKYPNATVFFMTPLHKTADSLAQDIELELYAKAIKDVGDKYSLPVLDLRKMSGIAPRVLTHKTLYMPDGLHPNVEGQKRISRVISSFIETI